MRRSCLCGVLLLFGVATAPAAESWMDPATGIVWNYTVEDDGAASLYYDAVPSETTGALVIPSSIQGRPVTSIGCQAFVGCNRLTSVTIPSSVKIIHAYAFHYCKGLTSVSIPQDVTLIGGDAFSGCSSLTSVTMPTCVSSLRSTFPDAYRNLREVAICDGVTRINDYAFYGCSGLISITIPRSVTDIGNAAFAGCSGLNEFIVDAANPAYCSINGLLLSKDCKVLVAGVGGCVDIPSGVVRIDDFAFSGCSKLKTVTIPTTMTYIGEDAFYDCLGLASVKVPPSVTNIGEGAFCGCSGLQSIELPFVGSERGNRGTKEALFGYVFGTSSYPNTGWTRQYYASERSCYCNIPKSLKSVTISDETEIEFGAF